MRQVLREHLRTHALRRQDVLVDAAVGVAQLRKLRVADKQPLQAHVAGEEVLLARLGDQHPLAQDAFQRVLAGLGRIEQLHVDARHLAAQPVDVALVRRIPFGLRDRLAIHLGHLPVAGFAELGIALDAEEDERGNDQQHQETEYPAGVRTEEFEHERWPRSLGGATQEGGSRPCAKRQRRTWVRLVLIGWWVLTGSNRRPTPCKGAALPAELSTQGCRRIPAGPAQRVS
jgi:hypothetical protein